MKKVVTTIHDGPATPVSREPWRPEHPSLATFDGEEIIPELSGTGLDDATESDVLCGGHQVHRPDPEEGSEYGRADTDPIPLDMIIR